MQLLCSRLAFDVILNVANAQHTAIVTTTTAGTEYCL